MEQGPLCGFGYRVSAIGTGFGLGLKPLGNPDSIAPGEAHSCKLPDASPCHSNPPSNSFQRGCTPSPLEVLNRDFRNTELAPPRQNRNHNHGNEGIWWNLPKHGGQSIAFHELEGTVGVGNPSLPKQQVQDSHQCGDDSAGWAVLPPGANAEHEVELLSLLP